MTERTILVDTYEILDVIGSGGGGVTYKARHLRLNTDVVVKKIKKNVIGSINIRAEADLLKNLKHAYLPIVYDFIEDETGVYTVIDFIPGENLEESVKKHGPYSYEKVLVWLKQLAEALDYLHSQNIPIIHSDIKPANIMLTPDGNVCLIDFNISLALGAAKESSVGVSPGFSPPEQFNSSGFYYQLVDRLSKDSVLPGAATVNADPNAVDVKNDKSLGKEETPSKKSTEPTIDEGEFIKLIGRGINTRSDIYSLGMTMIYLLTGTKPPVDYKKRTNLLSGVAISDGLYTILNKMICLDPDKRYKDGKALLHELNNIHKLEKKYKITKAITITSIISAFVLITLITVFTIYHRASEKQQLQSSYNYYLDQADIYIESGDYENALSQINEAIALDSDCGDAYREKVYLLYSSERYEDAINEGISYINSPSFSTWCEERTEGILQPSHQTIGDIMYLIGISYDELGDSNQALYFYEQALTYNQDNGLYYRDYAIALAKTGNTDEAISQLEMGKEHGLTEESVYLVNAQISFQNKQYDKAIDYSKQCLNVAEDQDVQKKVLFICSNAYSSLGIEYIDEKIALLCQYQDKFGKSGSLMVKEYLAAAYMEKATIDPTYNEKALEVYNGILSDGYSSFQIKENIAIIYGNMEEYDNAFEVLHELEKEYPDNYKVYKDLAYMEIYYQSSIDISERDYHNFKAYYDKASSLCKQTDDEMEMLSRTEQDLIDGGWALE